MLCYDVRTSEIVERVADIEPSDKTLPWRSRWKCWYMGRISEYWEKRVVVDGQMTDEVVRELLKEEDWIQV